MCALRGVARRFLFLGEWRRKEERKAPSTQSLCALPEGNSQTPDTLSLTW